MNNISKSLITQLQSIPSFKILLTQYDEFKEIYTIYLRITGDEDNDCANIKDVLNKIDNLDYKYTDFYIFEITFRKEHQQHIINQLIENF